MPARDSFLDDLECASVREIFPATSTFTDSNSIGSLSVLKARQGYDSNNIDTVIHLALPDLITSDQSHKET